MYIPHINNKLNHEYRKDLEGLRGLAVLGVVIYHLFPSYAPGGFVGVDIFFILSGYLIAKNILNNFKKKNFFFHFALGRIIRLLPALLLIVFTFIFIFSFFTLNTENVLVNKEIIYMLFFFSNVFYIFNINYFVPSYNFLLVHTWSLSLEMQFYIFIFFFFFITFKFKILTNIKKSLLIFLIFFSFFLFSYSLSKDINFTYFSFFTRIWEFLLGALLFLINYEYSNKITKTIKTSRYLSFFSGISIIYIFTFGNTNLIFNNYLIILLVLSTLLIIYSDRDCFFNKHILCNKVFTNFGIISYPLYLWHYFILSSASLILATGFPERNTRIIIFFISIFLSLATYFFWEKYFRNKKNSNRFILISLLFTFAFFLVFASLLFQEKINSQTKTFFKENIKKQFSGGMWKYHINDTCLQNYGNNYKIYKIFSYWTCIQSNTNAPTITILGNSFSNQLYPGFIYNDEFRKHSILSIGVCNFIPKYNSDSSIKSPCHLNQSFEETDFIDLMLKQNESVKFVIISGLNENLDNNDIKILKERISRIEKLNKQLIIFTNIHRPDFNLKKCFTIFYNLKENVCNFEKKYIEQDRNKKLVDLIKSINESNPKTLFFNSNQIFNCSQEKCSFIHDGMPLFRDDIHLSEYGSKIVIKKFSDWAKINLSTIF